MISRAAIERAARAMKQRRRSEIEHGVCRATFEEMATLALTAALAAEGMALGWRTDMENAPHNTNVLLAWRDWRDGTWCMEIAPAITGQRLDNGYSSISQHGSATHWAPRPAPPATAGKEG